MNQLEWDNHAKVDILTSLIQGVSIKEITAKYSAFEARVKTFVQTSVVHFPYEKWNISVYETYKNAQEGYPVAFQKEKEERILAYLSEENPGPWNFAKAKEAREHFDILLDEEGHEGKGPTKEFHWFKDLQSPAYAPKVTAKVEVPTFSDINFEEVVARVAGVTGLDPDIASELLQLRSLSKASSEAQDALVALRQDKSACKEYSFTWREYLYLRALAGK